jgi:hypothetical protein
MIVGNLAVGDIFHAASRNGEWWICLMTSVTETTIRARSAINDLLFEFDRQTGSGFAMWRDRKTPCAIYATDPLPEDIHNIILEMDRKSRLAEQDPRLGEDETKPWLNDDEKRALLYVAKHYSSKRP